jgi:hypothetical protein
MDRVVDSLEELSDLVNAEKRVGVENERNDDLTRGESAAFEGGVASVAEDVAAVGTPDPGTGVPGLDGGFAALWTESLFPRLLTAPLDFLIERLWAQDY